ncbi:hypothetical protein HU200_032766 [Digitaria exilis]|uniref:Thioesterase domain-containing protein n=1 Tax=Digitaria exilis TaxID=1010633 RepID=A0A835ENW0_9POAL|nr:hypothetical protein HU200_032766 [Digitaria exilis]
MLQQIGVLVRQVPDLSPRLRAAHGTSRLSTGAHGHRHRLVVVRTAGRARLGRVVAASRGASPGPKQYCRLRGVAAVAAPETSRELLFDQNGNAASNQLHQLITPTTMSKDRFFEIEMVVGDGDLDEYGVVNNAIYASYLHSGELVTKMGISVDYWTSTGNAMAVSELNLKYFAPLKSGDRFVVKVKPVQIKGVRIVVEHMIETLPDLFPELSASLVEVFSCKVA